MMCRVRAHCAFVFATAVSTIALSVSANAADLPQIKLSAKNAVPACVTPGRLTGFLEQRNKNLDSKFATIAADYARIGDELQIRWDTAFFQMLLETGNLTFTGDVSPKQNNFAGLGATGKNEPGESFPDVATGVKAHLQHLLLYAGEKLDNPVAERTRKVQEWGVLTQWQKTIDGPMTYVQLAKKWAPGSKNYARDVGNVAEAFMDGACKAADPKPEMMALVSGGADKATAAAETKTASADASADQAATPPKVSGVELARKAAEDARASGTYVRSSLGAGMLAAMNTPDKAASTAVATPTTPAAAQQAAPSVKILNAPKPEAAAAEAVVADPLTKVDVPKVESAKVEPKADTGKVQLAALGAGTKPAAAPPAVKPSPKCKVWTASYGGSRAVIIKAVADAQDNYTVLDVNEGTEQREAEAYISAYAKGGQKVGEFTSPTQALDKAFELCPEG